MPKFSEFTNQASPADTDVAVGLRSTTNSRFTLAAIKALFQSVANTAGKATQRDTDGSVDVGAVNLDTAASPTSQEGQIRWNATDKCAEVVQDSGVVVQIGQEVTVRARNSTGSTLANGTPVYVNGATGNRPTIAKADADAFDKSSTLIGLVTDSAGIGNNSDGHVCVFGLVRDLDTSAYSEGSTLYLSDGTSGTLTATKPTATGSFVVRVGYVTRSHASQGVILVSPQYMGSTTGDAVVNAATPAAARTAIGLGNVDNTSDANKPISTATQAALDALAEIPQSYNFTAVAGRRYVATASLTVTDPASPSNGQAYSVRISAGTTTIGGQPYSQIGATIVRAYNSGAWSTAVSWPNVSDYGPVVGACRTVLLGDSITRQNEGPGPYSLLPTYNAIVGYFTWANIRLGHRLAMVQNAGKAGDRTDQILARFATEVAPYAPHLVILMAGTNDVSQSVAYATIIANLTSLYDRIREIGATCVALTIPPIATANLSDANRTTLQKVNRWIKSQGRLRPRFIVVDIGDAILDATTTTFSASWTPAASMTSDGTHPTAAGSVLLGRRLADALSPFIYPGSLLTSGNADSNNLIANGAVNGTAGNWPTGWGGSAGTNTWTYPARTDGIAGTWAQVVVDNYIQLSGTNITSGFSTGDKIYVTCDYELTYTAGTVKSFYLALYRNGANVAADPATFVQFVDVPAKGVLETPAYTVPAGTTSLQAYLFLTLTGAGTTATLKLGRVGMHIGDPLAVN